MSLVTLYILEKSMALSTFDRSPIRYARGIGQTKRATMRAGGTIVLGVGIFFVTVVTIIFVFCHGRHGKYGIVMLVVV
jgi:hypothetical protein